jgi:membrane peptidoglycan carboxypeptidase
MGGKGPHGPYGIVAAVMQTALQRRQRHRRNGAARRGRGGGAARRAALAIPLLLFSSFLVLGGVGFVSTVSAYAYYSNGLPDPKQALDNIGFEQPSVVLDRTGAIQLATFGELKRELVTFDQIPPEMIDATTSIEDKDFWTNPGFDIGAIISAGLDTLAGRPRGASTITQQLVRAKLLPEEAFQGTVYDRKIREIIQSIRLTQAFPGQDGKKTIMQAYLNQNFYGNQSYGVQAASIGYFGKRLDKLDLAQFATLAAIPQSPTEYDLMRNAVSECQVTIAEDETCPSDKVTLEVPITTQIYARRNAVLDAMKTRSVLTAGKYTDAQFEAAKQEPMILSPLDAPAWKAPHFVWQVRKQLGTLLCGAENADTCEAVDTGGYTVTTTLNWKFQQVLDKWLYAAGRAPLAKTADGTRAILNNLGIKKSDQGWILGLRNKDIHNSAGSVIDYRTGQVLATSGSSDYYLKTKDPHFSPQYDVMFDAFRQPGSSIKPIGYITGLDDHTMTAATMFMDVVTEFEKNWSPMDADHLERGPVRLRSALQFSLNIPAIKSGYINGFDHLFAQYKKFGLSFLPGTVATPSMAIGTLEIHMIDLLNAYGAIANGGVLMPETVILQVKDHTGAVVYPTAENKPVGKSVASPQASYIISNILEGNTIKSVNAYWAAQMVVENGKRRPAAYKTGTTDESKDVDAFGFVAPPDDPQQPAIAVGVWMGNSDAMAVQPLLSTTSTAPLWNRIITEVTKGTPLASFKRPDGIVEKKIDAYSGMLPGPGTTKTITELFIKGTEGTLNKDVMHSAQSIDQATGLLWQDGCTGPKVDQEFLDFSQVEPRFPQWQKYTQEWAARAARGPGVRGGPKRTPTSYFFDGFLVPFGRTWGGKFAPTEVCAPVQQCQGNNGPPTPEPSAIVPCITPEPTIDTGPTPSKGGGGHHTLLPTLPVNTGPSARGDPATAVATVVFLPFAVPLFTLLLGRWFKPNRKERTPSRPGAAEDRR